ncbi:disease resistance protein RPM1-like [Gastrolobium bilobum]|uniref:disease resistance protein RPM1-like n=1 Tax=Gastrolobium bilobum TaxID=150636 RepID=UPI002AB142A3|nr:disease resistance protein RPM1-like [Gastrolobium bilobum]
MADIVVSFLLNNLPRLLEDEFKLLSGLEDKIISLTDELKFIDLFLKSSEGKRSNDFVKLLVSQIRDVAHQVEDVIDIYISNVTKHRNRNVFKKLLHFPPHVMELHDVNVLIEKIKSRIDEIYKNKERYGIGEGEFKSEEEVVVMESLRIVVYFTMH